MKNKNKIKLTIITLFISVLVYFFGFQNCKDYILKAALDKDEKLIEEEFSKYLDKNYDN